MKGDTWVPRAHYGFVVTRTDSSTRWGAFGGCDGCSREQAREKARAQVMQMLEQPDVRHVKLVWVTYSVEEIHGKVD